MDNDDHHHHAATPTCILKMNLKCCEQCPVRLNKKLQKMNGVKSVNIDQQRGLVTVSGNIDPVVFTENVSKLGKTAELWSFHKDASKASTLKDCCSCHGDSPTSDEDDCDDDDYQTPSTNKNDSVLITWQRPQQRTKDKTKTKTKTKKMNPIPDAGAGKDMYFNGPPRPVKGRPMGFHTHTAPEPPFSYGYDRPGPSWDPPGYPFDYGFGSWPWPGSGSGSGSRSPPKVNRMMKYTSYADNYLP